MKNKYKSVDDKRKTVFKSNKMQIWLGCMLTDWGD